MIKAEGLTKEYGALTAVDNVSFKVESGEVLGFLGPNGAGKTTTMRMFAGFVQPTSGYAEICGYRVDTRPTEAKACLGYLPEGAPSYSEMTPREFLEFIAAIRGLDAARQRERVAEVIDRLNLGTVLEQRIETLSKGFKRRVGLAQAILHDPPVLILDEPTDGLDPNQKHEVRELIAEMSSNKIIVISTHILEEVDAVCNRAIIISAGRIVADETPEALINQSRFHNAVTLRLEHGADLSEVARELRALPDVDHVEVFEEEHSVTAFPKDKALILTAIGDLAGERSWPLEQLHLESGRLDEVFRRITAPETAS
ncbi:MAG TPA: ABC transporter ATP-binding protein [Chromatiales bacterium]|nr:ABC transporter ATP-binding protein [Chromatiales bacterium]